MYEVLSTAIFSGVPGSPSEIYRERSTLAADSVRSSETASSTLQAGHIQTPCILHLTMIANGLFNKSICLFTGTRA